ncbi:hypothetical protein ABZ379_06220 [Streptomyces canus]
MSITLETPSDTCAPLIPVTITIQYDDDFTLDDWDESLRAEAQKKLNTHD